MLDIRIDGQSADLRPGTRLTLQRFNPMLDFTTVPGSRVYDFELNDTPTNRRLMGYADNPQQPTYKRRFYCEKYIDGNVIERGYARIREVNAGYKLNFSQDLGNVFGSYQDRPLSQLLELGAEPVPANPTAASNHLTDRYCFPVLLNPSFYGNAAVNGFRGRVNDYSGGAYASSGLVPHLFVRWVLTQFSVLTGWQFRGSFWDSNLFRRLLFYNLYSLDGQTTLTYCNHLPELTAGGLLIELRKLFNLWIDFDVRTKVCTLDLVDTILSDQLVLDWTNRANTRHVRLPDQNGRLELGYELSSNDARVKPTPAVMDVYQTPVTDINQDGVLLPVKSKFSTLLTDPVTGLATTDQAGYSVYNKDSKPSVEARFLIWNGMVGGLPTATNTTDSVSLLWHGNGNLVDSHWRNFEAFRTNTFLLKKTLTLAPADIATFSYRNRIHIRGVNYLIGDLSASLERNQRSVVCEVDLWRV